LHKSARVMAPHAVICSLCGGKFFKSSLAHHQKVCREKVGKQCHECAYCHQLWPLLEMDAHIRTCPAAQAAGAKPTGASVALAKRLCDHKHRQENGIPEIAEDWVSRSVHLAEVVWATLQNMRTKMTLGLLASSAVESLPWTASASIRLSAKRLLANHAEDQNTSFSQLLQCRAIGARRARNSERLQRQAEVALCRCAQNLIRRERSRDPLPVVLWLQFGTDLLQEILQTCLVQKWHDQVHFEGQVLRL